MNTMIREIRAEDNAGVEKLIRGCLVEFGADHEGTAWADPDLGRFSEVYSAPGSRYWVAADETGRVLAGAGIGPMPGLDGVCELQKMYSVPAVRGTGLSHKLMETALSFARQHYRACYLETLENMIAAQRFYEKYDFRRIRDALGETGHFACDVRYLKEL